MLEQASHELRQRARLSGRMEAHQAQQEDATEADSVLGHATPTPPVSVLNQIVVRVSWEVVARCAEQLLETPLPPALRDRAGVDRLITQVRALYQNDTPLQVRFERLDTLLAELNSLVPAALQASWQPLRSVLSRMRPIVCALTGPACLDSAPERVGHLIGLVEHLLRELAGHFGGAGGRGHEPSVGDREGGQGRFDAMLSLLGSIRLAVDTIGRMMALPADATFDTYLTMLDHLGSSGIDFPVILGPWLRLAGDLAQVLHSHVSFARDLPSFPTSGGPAAQLAWLTEILADEERVDVIVRSVAPQWQDAVGQARTWLALGRDFPVNDTIGQQAIWILQAARRLPGLTDTPIAPLLEAIDGVLSGDPVAQAVRETVMTICDPAASWTDVGWSIIDGMWRTGQLRATMGYASHQALQWVPYGGTLAMTLGMIHEVYQRVASETSWSAVGRKLYDAMLTYARASDALPYARVLPMLDRAWRTYPWSGRWSDTLSWLLAQAAQHEEFRPLYSLYVQVSIGWQVMQACRQATRDQMRARLTEVVRVLQPLNATYGYAYLDELLEWIPLIPDLNEARVLLGRGAMSGQTSTENGSWVAWMANVGATLANTDNPTLQQLYARLNDQCVQRLSQGVMAGFDWLAQPGSLGVPVARAASLSAHESRSVVGGEGVSETDFMAIGEHELREPASQTATAPTSGETRNLAGEDPGRPALIRSDMIDSGGASMVQSASTDGHRALAWGAGMALGGWWLATFYMAYRAHHSGGEQTPAAPSETPLLENTLATSIPDTHVDRSWSALAKQYQWPILMSILGTGATAALGSWMVSRPAADSAAQHAFDLPWLEALRAQVAAPLGAWLHEQGLPLQSAARPIEVEASTPSGTRRFVFRLDDIVLGLHRAMLEHGGSHVRVLWPADWPATVVEQAEHIGLEHSGLDRVTNIERMGAYHRVERSHRDPIAQEYGTAQSASRWVPNQIARIESWAQQRSNLENLKPASDMAGSPQRTRYLWSTVASRLRSDNTPFRTVWCAGVIRTDMIAMCFAPITPNPSVVSKSPPVDYFYLIRRDGVIETTYTSGRYKSRLADLEFRETSGSVGNSRARVIARLDAERAVQGRYWKTVQEVLEAPVNAWLAENLSASQAQPTANVTTTHASNELDEPRGAVLNARADTQVDVEVGGAGITDQAAKNTTTTTRTVPYSLGALYYRIPEVEFPNGVPRVAAGQAGIEADLFDALRNSSAASRFRQLARLDRAELGRDPLSAAYARVVLRGVIEQRLIAYLPDVSRKSAYDAAVSRFRASQAQLQMVRLDGTAQRDWVAVRIDDDWRCVIDLADDAHTWLVDVDPASSFSATLPTRPTTSTQTVTSAYDGQRIELGDVMPFEKAINRLLLGLKSRQAYPNTSLPRINAPVALMQSSSTWIDAWLEYTYYHAGMSYGEHQDDQIRVSTQLGTGATSTVSPRELATGEAARTLGVRRFAFSALQFPSGYPQALKDALLGSNLEQDLEAHLDHVLTQQHTDTALTRMIQAAVANTGLRPMGGTLSFENVRYRNKSVAGIFAVSDGQKRFLCSLSGMHIQLSMAWNGGELGPGLHEKVQIAIQTGLSATDWDEVKPVSVPAPGHSRTLFGAGTFSFEAVGGEPQKLAERMSANRAEMLRLKIDEETLSSNERWMRAGAEMGKSVLMGLGVAAAVSLPASWAFLAGLMLGGLEAGIDLAQLQWADNARERDDALGELVLGCLLNAAGSVLDLDAMLVNFRKVAKGKVKEMVAEGRVPSMMELDNWAQASVRKIAVPSEPAIGDQKALRFLTPIDEPAVPQPLTEFWSTLRVNAEMAGYLNEPKLKCRDAVRLARTQALSRLPRDWRVEVIRLNTWRNVDAGPGNHYALRIRQPFGEAYVLDPTIGQIGDSLRTTFPTGFLGSEGWWDEIMRTARPQRLTRKRVGSSELLVDVSHEAYPVEEAGEILNRPAWYQDTLLARAQPIHKRLKASIEAKEGVPGVDHLIRELGKLNDTALLDYFGEQAAFDSSLSKLGIRKVSILREKLTSPLQNSKLDLWLRRLERSEDVSRDLPGCIRELDSLEADLQEVIWEEARRSAINVRLEAKLRTLLAMLIELRVQRGRFEQIRDTGLVVSFPRSGNDLQAALSDRRSLLESLTDALKEPDAHRVMWSNFYDLSLRQRDPLELRKRMEDSLIELTGESDYKNARNVYMNEWGLADPEALIDPTCGTSANNLFRLFAEANVPLDPTTLSFNESASFTDVLGGLQPDKNYVLLINDSRIGHAFVLDLPASTGGVRTSARVMPFDEARPVFLLQTDMGDGVTRQLTFADWASQRGGDLISIDDLKLLYSPEFANLELSEMTRLLASTFDRDMNPKLLNQQALQRLSTKLRDPTAKQSSKSWKITAHAYKLQQYRENIQTLIALASRKSDLMTDTVLPASGLQAVRVSASEQKFLRAACKLAASESQSGEEIVKLALDNRLNIYTSRGTPAKTLVIRGHSGFVRPEDVPLPEGVTFEFLQEHGAAIMSSPLPGLNLTTNVLTNPTATRFARIKKVGERIELETPGGPLLVRKRDLSKRIQNLLDNQPEEVVEIQLPYQYEVKPESQVKSNERTSFTPASDEMQLVFTAGSRLPGYLQNYIFSRVGATMWERLGRIGEGPLVTDLDSNRLLAKSGRIERMDVLSVSRDNEVKLDAILDSLKEAKLHYETIVIQACRVWASEPEALAQAPRRWLHVQPEVITVNMNSQGKMTRIGLHALATRDIGLSMTSTTSSKSTEPTPVSSVHE
ncbi:hypothetical protein WT71_02295 [Burkholderia stagnalis]|nr:hypothetical protein WT71_02295 [Burkholderia stagnalis]KWI71083.1 hypothetical protein WT73_13990 [Burkholderia stagnalis]